MACSGVRQYGFDQQALKSLQYCLLVQIMVVMIGYQSLTNCFVVVLLLLRAVVMCIQNVISSVQRYVRSTAVFIETKQKRQLRMPR